MCKEPGLGLEFHHIDGNPSNTVEENIAVLCVRDHDKEQRPHRYSKAKHTDLHPDQIIQYKESWEAFVEEASKPNTEVLGLAILYGVGEIVSALRLTFQWDDQVMWDKMINVTDSPLQSWGEQIVAIANWLGEHVRIVVENEIIQINFCEKCARDGRFSRLDPKLHSSSIKKYTRAAWDTDSSVSIYVDPQKPFFSLGVLLEDEPIHGVYIYKQGKSVATFCTEPSCKCHSTSFEEELSPENLEEQVKYILNSLLVKWEPARCNIFTLKDNTPVLLNDITRKDNAPVLLNKITLHKVWYEDNQFNLSDIGQSIVNAFLPEGE